MDLIASLGLRLPIFQAPMAGTATPALAAAVSISGGLGGLGLGGCMVGEAAALMDAVKSATTRPFNVNLFCHESRACPPAAAAVWCDLTAPLLQQAGAAPVADLPEPAPSFLNDPAMLALLLDRRPAVVSFHFGLPPASTLAALRGVGAVLLASATSLAEGRAIAAAGLDGVIAQGWSAGGHRGIFDPDGADDQLGTLDLTRALSQALPIPVIAAGGIMDGRDLALALRAGAVAGQMGTAFIACPESAADATYRAVLLSGLPTRMTKAVSGRPARFLATEAVQALDALPDAAIPPFPHPYAVGDALAQAVRGGADLRFHARLAGEGAARARAMPAADLMRVIAAELAASA